MVAGEAKFKLQELVVNSEEGTGGVVVDFGNNDVGEVTFRGAEKLLGKEDDLYRVFGTGQKGQEISLNVSKLPAGWVVSGIVGEQKMAKVYGSGENDVPIPDGFLDLLNNASKKNGQNGK